MNGSADAPAAEVIPYLFYRDVPAALDFLGRAFGFVEELRHPTASGMHAQMTLHGRRIMMGQGTHDGRMHSPAEAGVATQGVFVYLPDVDAHHARAVAAGAEIVDAPRDLAYGRSYTARDLDGHPWFFTTAPEEGPAAVNV